jgi:hypothetical protein
VHLTCRVSRGDPGAPEQRRAAHGTGALALPSGHADRRARRMTNGLASLDRPWPGGRDHAASGSRRRACGSRGRSVDLCRDWRKADDDMGFAGGAGRPVGPAHLPVMMALRAARRDARPCDRREGAADGGVWHGGGGRRRFANGSAPLPVATKSLFNFCCSPPRRLNASSDPAGQSVNKLPDRERTMPAAMSISRGSVITNHDRRPGGDMAGVL